MMRRQRSQLLRGGLGVALIWAAFLPGFTSDHRLLLDWRPSLPLFGVLALLGFMGWARWRLTPSLRWLLAAAMLVLAGLQGVNAAVEHLLDRPLDLYFDLRHVPNLLGLYLDAVGSARGGLVIAAVIVALAATLILLAYALASLDTVVKTRLPLALAALLVGLIGLAAAPVTASRAGLVNNDAAFASWQQARGAWRAFAVLHGLDRRDAAALAAPQPALATLPGLKDRDVYLIFVESFGTVVLDEPAYRAALEPALQGFAATVKEAGYQLVSNRLLSPTYGGGSWLAHGTIASGVKLDALLSEVLLNSDRLGLPRYMAAAGYRTVEVMPGIKKAYPEDRFWGFDAHDFGADLGYRGPPFGWFDIPDQFTLAQFSSRELQPGHPPLFAQIVLVSSHTPFAPVPPYLADWGDAGKFATVPQGDWARIYAPPDWNNLDRPYLDSLAYDLKTLGAWLAQLDNDALVIVLGDHQPPELTRGGNQPWTVPIYVLSRDPDLVAPFAALGYTPGDEPPAEAHSEGMEKFLGEFLTGFSASVATAASTPPQNPGAPAVFQP